MHISSRENLNNRAGQTDSTTVDEYYLTWTKKRVILNLNEGPYI